VTGIEGPIKGGYQKRCTETKIAKRSIDDKCRLDRPVADFINLCHAAQVAPDEGASQKGCGSHGPSGVLFEEVVIHVCEETAAARRVIQPKQESGEIRLIGHTDAVYSRRTPSDKRIVEHEMPPYGKSLAPPSIQSTMHASS
jgi:hypothetical protein